MKLLAIFAAMSIVISATAAAQTDSPKVEEQAIPARDGATVFGLLLGQDKLTDVESRVQLPEGSICKIVRSKKECRPTYEIEKLGYIRNRGNSIPIDEYGGVSPSAADVLFAKFSVDGEYLTGTFFKGTLVALSVTGKYGNDLDSSVDATALMASFDKKYKKQGSPFVKSSTENGVTDKYTYRLWRDTVGKFDIQLTRHDSILVNKVACLQYLRTMLSLSKDIYDQIKHQCDGSSVDHKLVYLAPELYLQAFEQARQLEAAEEAQKKKASTNRVNKY
jgi:hypothetical protein